MTRRSRARRGFTMLEMLIVVALIGIVATLAMPQFRHSTLKARESVLRNNLWVMRDVIDQFYTDKGRYPEGLEELVSSGYLRRIPEDPITQSTDTWEVEVATTLAEDGEEEEDPEAEPGIIDVRSGAQGLGLDGTPYSEW